MDICQANQWIYLDIQIADILCVDMNKEQIQTFYINLSTKKGKAKGKAKMEYRISSKNVHYINSWANAWASI